MKWLTNGENASSNIFQGICSGCPIAACDSRSSFESRLRSQKLFRKLAMNVTWRKLTERRTAEAEILMRLSEQSLEFSKRCQRSKQEFIVIILFK